MEPNQTGQVNYQPTPQQSIPAQPAPVTLPPQPGQTPPQPLPIMPSPLQPKKSKKKLLMIILGVVGALVLLIGGYLAMSYMSLQSNKKAGLEKIDSFIEDVKENNTEELQSVFYRILDVDENTTDPEKINQFAKAGAQTAVVSTGLNQNEPTRYKTSIGRTNPSEKTDNQRLLVVEAAYEIKINNETGYYDITAVKKDGIWEVLTVELSEQKL